MVENHLNTSQEEQTAQLIRTVRQSFQRLRTVADNLHAERGITAPMRAVLEYLQGGAAATVPQIAEQKSVSRQHIQQVVNGLMDQGLAITRPNPRHRRSVLVQLTGQGEAVFDQIANDEIELVTTLAGALKNAPLNVAIDALDQFNQALHKIDARPVTQN